MTATALAYRAPLFLSPLQRRALAVGVIGLAACAIGAFFNPGQFFRSYLLAYLLYCGLALGCLLLQMMGYLTGGLWGVIPRRILEAAAKTLPLLAVLFIPIVIGLPWLYEWARPEAVAKSPLLQHKHGYLNVPFFLLRSVGFFAVTIAYAYQLAGWSQQQQSQPAPPLQSKLQRASGPGLLLCGLLTTFVFVDWVMSLTPQWYSSIFGLLILCGQALSAYAFVIVMLVVLARCPPLSLLLSTKLLHDLGKLLQACVLLWAYLGFSQLLIVWTGNLPREVGWYVPRLNTSWRWLGLLLVVAHFALPFGLLLSRQVKRQASTLVALAGFLLVMRLVDQFWLVEPNFHPSGFHLSWLDGVAPVGLGGVWLAGFCWLLQRSPILPLGDPALDAAMT